jgi:hypothetical protein
VRCRWCAGAYVSGAAGSNECPAGSVRIETEAACRAAAAAAGKIVGSSSLPFVETDADYPRGCYYVTRNNYAYFNTHAVGAGSPNYRLLCAAATTGAPLPHRASVRARVDWAVLAGGVHNNATNGRHRDTRTYIHRHKYTYIPVWFRRRSSAGPRGARQRRRTAGGRTAGGRACTGTARKGTQEGVRKKGCSGAQKRCTHGYSWVLPRYSKVLTPYCAPCRAPATLVGARAATRVRRGRHCTAGTPWQYSRNTVSVMSRVPQIRSVDVSHGIAQRAAPLGLRI